MHVLGMPFGMFLLLIGQKKLTHRITKIWCKLLFFVGGQPLHIVGLENLDPNGKYLFVMNHASFLDIHAMLAVKPNMTWLSKKELLKAPLIGAGLKASGGIPIDREHFSESLDEACVRIKEAAPGFALGMFPEGTRTLNGNLGKFKRGFVRLLRGSDLELVPVTMNGFFRFRPKKGFFFHKIGRIEAIVHPPISQSETAKMSDDEVIAKVTEIIQKDYVI